METEEKFENVKADLGATEPMGQPQGNGQKVDINATTAVNCVQCGGEFFKESTILRRVPANLSQNGQEQVVPVKLLRCEVCGRAA